MLPKIKNHYEATDLENFLRKYYTHIAFKDAIQKWEKDLKQKYYFEYIFELFANGDIYAIIDDDASEIEKILAYAPHYYIGIDYGSKILVLEIECPERKEE